MKNDRTLLEAGLQKVEQAIATQEGLRGILSVEQIEDTLNILRDKQATLREQLTGLVATAQVARRKAQSEGGVVVRRDIQSSAIITGDNNCTTYIINNYFKKGAPSVPMMMRHRPL